MGLYKWKFLPSTSVSGTMWNLAIILTAFLCGQAALVHSLKEDYIVNGKEAPYHRYPWQAFLNTYPPSGSGSSLCGGSLIAPQWVLTAAHCFKGRVSNPGTAKITLGAHNIQKRESTTQVFNSVKVLIHSSWTGRIAVGSNDIALIKLDRPATLNEYVKTIRIPKDDLQTYEGHPATLSGWGELWDHSGASDTLQFTIAPIISNARCIQEYSRSSVGENHICASGAGLNAICSGDSGGPLVVYERDGKPTLVGITSFSHGSRCDSGKAGVFTRVSKFLDWILPAMRSN